MRIPLHSKAHIVSALRAGHWYIQCYNRRDAMRSVWCSTAVAHLSHNHLCDAGGHAEGKGLACRPLMSMWMGRSL